MSSERMPASTNCEPQWAPLERLFSQAECAPFLWMGETRHGETRIEHYKHRDTRRYLHLDGSGQAYDSVSPPAPGDPDTSCPMPLGDAIAQVLAYGSRPTVHQLSNSLFQIGGGKTYVWTPFQMSQI